MSHYALRYSITAAFLLQACAAPPPRAPEVRPAMQVTHSANETAEAFYQLGRQHHQQGNLDVAMTGYSYAIARDPRHLEARSAAASIHAQQGRLEQARALMLAVIADYPGHAQSYNNLGYIDYLRGEHAAAVAAIRRALALEPRNARARNNLALAQAALAGHAPAPAGAPMLAAAPEAPAAPLPALAVPAAVHPAQLELVQVVPNIYELRRPAERAAAPALLALQPAALPAARIEVSNGAGVTGLARRVGAMLGQHGYAVARLSNLRPFGLRTTRIEFLPGHQDRADAMRKLIEGPVQIAQVQSGAADVRLVLGTDTQRALALRDAGAGLPRVAAR
jgi:Flp pilus assembly protein TadD